MKQINIFGRKVSVVAVLMVALLVGTASAALISNYATLTGGATVTSSITVVGDGVDNLEITFVGGVGDFIIENSGNEPVTVELIGIISPVTGGPTTDGLTIVYDGNGVSTEGIVTSVVVPAVGQTTVTVTLDAVPEIETGTYIVTIAVNPPAI